MGQHREQHVVMPAGIFPHFILRHPKLRFPFLKTLFHRPADATQPDQGAQGRARWGMTDIVGICWFHTQRPFDHQPARALGQALLAQRHALAGKRLGKRSLGAF